MSWPWKDINTLISDSSRLSIISLKNYNQLGDFQPILMVVIVATNMKPFCSNRISRRMEAHGKCESAPYMTVYSYIKAGSQSRLFMVIYSIAILFYKKAYTT